MSSNDFLSLAYDVVHRHYQNPDFDVTRFARQMGVSRVHLSRNLKRLTGCNASRFLCQQRLMKAAQRLKDEPKTSITEIAYDAGFGSHAYFSRCFYKLFRQTPKDYRNEA